MVLGDDDVAARVGVVDVEVAVRRVVGVEGEAEQSAFLSGCSARDEATDIEERRDAEGRCGVRVVDADLAALLDDKQPRIAGAGIGDGGWEGKSAGDGGERNAVRGGRGRRAAGEA